MVTLTEAPPTAGIYPPHDPGAPGADRSGFIQHRIHPKCEGCDHDFFRNEYRDTIDPATGVRTIFAPCPHCKTRHTQRLVLRGGEWIVDGPPLIEHPAPGLVERIADAQADEHDRELLRAAMARMEALLARARDSLDADRPLSADDRRQIERLDTDYDASKDDSATADMDDHTAGRDQASKLRELVYSDEDPAAPPVLRGGC